MKTAALWLAALLCACPALAQTPYRIIYARPQAEVVAACEAAYGAPAFWCATWLADANTPTAPPACIMRIPIGLEQNLERYEEVLAELREACANPPANLIGAR